jgi:hypothetical protein
VQSTELRYPFEFLQNRQQQVNNRAACHDPQSYIRMAHRLQTVIVQVVWYLYHGTQILATWA